MRPNALKAALRAGKPQLGTFAKLTDPASIEILGFAGFDFIIVDREHTQMSDDVMMNLLRAADLHQLSTVVRVQEFNPASILRALDAGAQGVMVPQVNTPAMARAVIDAVKYSPIGRRGFAASQRAAAYGFCDPAAYAEQANAESLVVSYVETKEAVESLDETLRIGEIDVIFLGPADLSASYGLIGQVKHPTVQGAMDTVVQKARTAGKAVGTVCRDAAGAKALVERGLTFISLDSDQGLLAQFAQRTVNEFRG